MVVLAGCESENAAEDPAPEMESLYFEPIGYGQRASLSDTVEVVIRDAEEWNALRDSLRPIAPFEPVDFSQVVVLVAALPQENSGYAVEFRSVDVVGSVVVAEYAVQVPGDDCLAAYAETVPFQAVLARRTDLPVRFERVEEEYRCSFGPRRR